jgi:gamma-F420-2:alpha-L-glutamate ligase
MIKKQELIMKGLYGWIVYNGNLETEKFIDFARGFEDAGKRQNMKTELVKNNELLVTIENGAGMIKGRFAQERPDFVLFCDKDIRLAEQLEALGIPVYNSGRTIEACDNKAITYQMLSNHEIPIPKTIIAPKVFSGITVTDFSPYPIIAEEIGFPMVIKEAYGSFGQQVYLIHSYEDMIEMVKKLGSRPYLFQEFVKTSYGRDVRLNVVGDQVVASMYRSSDSDFRANITNGGTMERYTPSQKEKELAIACSKIVGAAFSGVDLLFGKNDEPIVCEINSNAHIRNIFECTGVNVADYIMAHIEKDVRSR